MKKTPPVSDFDVMEVTFTDEAGVPFEKIDFPRAAWNALARKGKKFGMSPEELIVHSLRKALMGSEVAA